MIEGALPVQPFAAASIRAGNEISTGTSDGSVTMLIDLVPIWTLILGLAVFYYVVFDGFDLGVGILSGLVSPEWRAADDELGRAGVGRQRDLAGARQHRPAGGVPARFRDHHSRGLFPDR